LLAERLTVGLAKTTVDPETLRADEAASPQSDAAVRENGSLTVATGDRSTCTPSTNCKR
jgi:hypothetical protein